MADNKISELRDNIHKELLTQFEELRQLGLVHTEKDKSDLKAIETKVNILKVMAETMLK